MLKLNEIASLINKFNTFAIVCHIRPDGDSVGSAMSLKIGLEQLNKKADVFCADAIPEKFGALVDISSFKQEITANYDAFISVDCSDEGRIGDLFTVYNKCRNTFNVDHHISNSCYAKYNYVLDGSSNCENIYNLLIELGVTIDCKIATALLLGILTDTGNLSHKDVVKSTFNVVGELVEKGADLYSVYYEMFKRKTKQKAKLFTTVNSKIRYMLEDRLAIVVITEKDLTDCGALTSDTEGIIDFVLSIDTVEVAISIMEVNKNSYKISLRGKSTDVNAIASVYGGGGHVLASGCMINGYLEDVIDKLSYTVSQHLV